MAGACMNDKYLMPYRKVPRLDVKGHFSYSRATLNGFSVGFYWQQVAYDRLNAGKWCRELVFGGDRQYFDTEEEAERALDQYLIDNGYVILTEEQALLV